MVVTEEESDDGYDLNTGQYLGKKFLGFSLVHRHRHLAPHPWFPGKFVIIYTYTESKFEVPHGPLCLGKVNDN